MDQHDNNQHDGTDANCRHWFKSIWDPGQKPWNIDHAITQRPRSLSNLIRARATYFSN